MNSDDRKFGMLIDTGGFNRVVRGRHGDFAYNRNDIYIGRSLEKYGEFSEMEVELFQQLCREGDTVIEVGANIGTHTIPLAKRVGATGQVIAFEPQTSVFQLLSANVALNSLPNVRCLQVAVGAQAGQVRVPNLAVDQACNFGGLGLENAAQGQSVPLVALDATFQAGRLRLLKVDVEGMEQKVLLGAAQIIRSLRPALYVENDRPERSQELIECIAAMDYELFWHLPPLFNPNNFAGDAENVFPNLVSVNMLCVPRSAADSIVGLERVTDPTQHPLQPKSN